MTDVVNPRRTTIGAPRAGQVARSFRKVWRTVEYGSADPRSETKNDSVRAIGWRRSRCRAYSRNMGTAVGCKGTSRDLWNLDARIMIQPWPQSTSPRLILSASEIRKPVQMSRPINVA